MGLVDKDWKVQYYYSNNSRKRKIGISEDAYITEGLICSDVINLECAELISKAPRMLKLLKEVLENCEATDGFASATLFGVRLLLEELDK